MKVFSPRIEYDIEQEEENDVVFIKFLFTLPIFEIRNILNFRIHNITYNDGTRRADPISIEDSLYIHEFTEKDFNKSVEVEFFFDAENIKNITSFCFGFCNEFVAWDESSFVTVYVKQSLPTTLPVGPVDYNKICILSTWDIKCGIAEYCKHIYNSLLSKNCEVKVFDNKTGYEEIYKFILQNSYGIFVIQFEPSIINNIYQLIEYITKMKQINNKIKVYLVIHSENHILNSIEYKVDGFIYHKKPSMQFANVKRHIIPMGVPVFNPEISKLEYRTKYEISAEKFIVSTLGFMFTWKQHANFLQKMVPYLKENNDLTVQFLTSFHSINNEQCVIECSKIQNIIKENKLESQVIHVTDYIPQKELSERLYLSDLGFLWAGIETTSSSASLKEFVSARLPVVKTNSSHLHDITTGCMMVGQDMDVFVNKVVELYKNRNILDSLRSEMEENYNKINYNIAIDNFINVFSNSEV